ncbi:MAG: hypothetical protein ABJK20_16155 [Halieaceae bacterium]
MERRYQGKASLVDFLRSIKVSQARTATNVGECNTHFAHFVPRVQRDQHGTIEESQLIRSAN